MDPSLIIFNKMEERGHEVLVNKKSKREYKGGNILSYLGLDQNLPFLVYKLQ